MCIELLSLPITRRLPTHCANMQGDVNFPADLINAEVIAIGSPGVAESLENEGLFIDYRPRASATVKRIVLGFNEIDMWINALGDRIEP
jgi:hypothetical protein